MASTHSGSHPAKPGQPARVPRNRMRPLVAWRAMRRLMQDPDDTVQVFKIIRALAGNSNERTFQRFAKSETGRKILEERRSLFDRLSDRNYLLSLPQGSLGRLYADFTAREEISPEGLTGPSEAVQSDLQDDPDRLLFRERIRDMHDLWHVVTGYGRDLIGEAALLAFTYRQTRNRGIGFIVFVAYVRAGRVLPAEQKMIVDGYRRARGVAWMPGADWEALLERPIEEVRTSLQLVPAEPYEPVRSKGAPALA